MPTIFTVGTGGTHATLQAAYDAIPGTLADQYIIRLKKQEFVFTGSSIPLVISPRVTTASFNIIIECDTGASFKDDANVRTNPLRYDASKGAAIRCEDASAIIFSAGSVNHLTIRGIQIKQQATALASFDIIVCQTGGTATNRVIQDCIIEQEGSDHNDILFLIGTTKVLNCVIIHGGNNPDSGIKLSDVGAGFAVEVIGCTVVRPSNLAAGSTSIGLNNKFNENSYTAKNNVVMGFNTDAVSLSSGSDYNATSFSDAASGFNDPATDHNVYDVVYNTNLFEQPSNASGLHDYRLKQGAVLANVGLYDGTNSPADVTGLTRNNPPDIGAWELDPLTAQAVISAFSRFSGSGSQTAAPFKIDDRTIALGQYGQTKRNVKFNPIIVGNDFRARRTYTGLTGGAIIASAEFTVKKSLRDPDNQSLIRKVITASLTETGQITDQDASGGSIAMYFDAFGSETGGAKFDTEYPYYIKGVTATGAVHTLETGVIPFVRK